MSPRSNVVLPLRWSQRAAMAEFEVSQSMLLARLDDAEERPGDDQCYSTRQLVNALFGTLRDARLKKLRLESEQLELENARLKGEMLPKAELERFFGEIAAAMVQIIKGSKLSREGQDDIRRQLASIPIIIRDVARTQSRRSRNGDSDGDGKEPALVNRGDEKFSQAQSRLAR